MKILAIDTSSKICTVAILEDTKLIKQLDSNDEKTHSQKLMPLVDEIFKQTNLTLDDINLLACTVGPGSFTGVRIAVSTVKAFADVKEIPVCSISSLEALAYNLDTNNLVCSLIDAKNDNVYFGLFQKENNTYIIKEKFLAEHIDNILPILTKYDSQIVFVGDGSQNHKNKILEVLPTSIFSDKNDAIGYSVGLAGYYNYKNNNYGDSNTLSPLYLRKSQAERALEEKNNG